MTAADFLSPLRAELGDALEQHHESRGELWARVTRSAWRRAAEVASAALGCRYFCFLSGMDWQPNPELDGEKAYAIDHEPGPRPPVIVDEAIRLAGGASRFQVVARVYNTDMHAGLTLTADLDDNAPAVQSWTPVYRGADWHERETAEMFGFAFDGHPGLRHIYLPEEFEGYPLRKDFPLLARMVRPWPGLVDMEDMPTPPPGQARSEEGPA